MKRNVVLLLLIFMLCNAFAQSHDIYLSVAVPQNCILEENCRRALVNKVLSLCTTEGVAAKECGAIVIVPEVNLLDQEVVEGGMRNIYTMEMCINLKVMNVMSGTVFNTLSMSVKGEGYNKVEAERSVIRKLDMSKCSDFVRITKDKVADYYSHNTKVLIQKAQTLAAQQNYEEALALLASYPEFLSDYSEVSSAIKSIYQRYLTQNCEEVLMLARAEISKRNYDVAANIAASIDPSSSCYNDASEILSLIKSDVDEMYKVDIANERDIRKSQERFAIAEINAARDIAVAYYKRKTTNIFLW